MEELKNLVISFTKIKNLELFCFSIINIIKNNFLEKLNVNFKNFSLYSSYLLCFIIYFWTSFK